MKILLLLMGAMYLPVSFAGSVLSPPDVSTMNSGALTVTPIECADTQKLHWNGNAWKCVNLTSSGGGGGDYAFKPLCFYVELDRSDKSDKTFRGGPQCNVAYGRDYNLYEGAGHSTYNDYTLGIIINNPTPKNHMTPVYELQRRNIYHLNVP